MANTWVQPQQVMASVELSETTAGHSPPGGDAATASPPESGERPVLSPDLLNLDDAEMATLYDPGQQNELFEHYYRDVHQEMVHSTISLSANESFESLIQNLQELSQPDLPVTCSSENYVADSVDSPCFPDSTEFNAKLNTSQHHHDVYLGSTCVESNDYNAISSNNGLKFPTNLILDEPISKPKLDSSPIEHTQLNEVTQGNSTVIMGAEENVKEEMHVVDSTLLLVKDKLSVDNPRKRQISDVCEEGATISSSVSNICYESSQLGADVETVPINSPAKRLKMTELCEDSELNPSSSSPKNTEVLRSDAESENVVEDTSKPVKSLVDFFENFVVNDNLEPSTSVPKVDIEVIEIVDSVFDGTFAQSCLSSTAEQHNPTSSDPKVDVKEGIDEMMGNVLEEVLVPICSDFTSELHHPESSDRKVDTKEGIDEVMVNVLEEVPVPICSDLTSEVHHPASSDSIIESAFSPCNQQPDESLQTVTNRAVSSSVDTQSEVSKLTDDVSSHIHGQLFNSDSVSKSENVELHCYEIMTDSNTENPAEDLLSSNRVQCEECDEMFDEMENLNEHYSEVHDKTEYTCDTCGKTFTSTFRLRLHWFAAHTSKKNTKSKGTKTKSNPPKEKSMAERKLRPRKETEKSTGEARSSVFECDQCEKQFHTTAVYLRHITSHQKKPRQSSLKAKFQIKVSSLSFTEKSFSCDFCHHPYGRASDLKKHVLSVHTQVAPSLKKAVRASKSHSNSAKKVRKVLKTELFLEDANIFSEPSEFQPTCINNNVIEVQRNQTCQNNNIIKVYRHRTYQKDIVLLDPNKKIVTPHANAQNLEVDLFCTTCQMSFPNHVEFAQHKQLTLPVCCSECEASFLFESELSSHICCLVSC